MESKGHKCVPAIRTLRFNLLSLISVCLSFVMLQAGTCIGIILNINCCCPRNLLVFDHISECGGKMHLREADYEKAHTDFFEVNKVNHKG